jgi:hypothetical protein
MLERKLRPQPLVNSCTFDRGFSTIRIILQPRVASELGKLFAKRLAGPSVPRMSTHARPVQLPVLIVVSLERCGRPSTFYVRLLISILRVEMWKRYT